MPAPPFLSAEVLLKERRVESHRLEFKAGWDEQTQPAIIKTICAFANDLPNQNGGYVILGVEDAGGKAVLPPKGLDAESLEKVSKELVGAVRHWIDPEYVPRVFTDQQVDGRHVLVVHCSTGDNRPYSAPERLEKGPRFPWVRVGCETKKVFEGELRRQLEEVCQRTPFDAQPCRDLMANDLSFDLVEAFLKRAGSKLIGEEISLDDKLRGLDLLQQVNGHEAPRNAALLFFQSEPWRRFRGARIDIVSRDDTGTVLHEQEITGSLPALIEQALTSLKNQNPVLVRKHDDRAEADRDAAWPNAAIEEVVVNAVHHRGYDPENPDAIKVDLFPDRMVVTSYPGPMPGLTLEQLDRAEVVNVRARNKHVGELLKAIKLAETRSSGIRTIRQTMERAGNPAPLFDFDQDRTYFKVTLPIHPVHLPHASALPLRLSVPAPAGELVGREGLIERVNRRLDLRNVCLFAPRGRGVSSLLNGLEVVPTGERRHRLDLSRLDEDQFEQYVDEVLAQRVEGERLVFLLDHCDPNWGAIRHLVQQAEVRVVAAPPWLPDHRDGDWWNKFDLIVVPPLSSADARLLAVRLLAGLGRRHAEALALAIEQVSAGIPRLIHLLVARVHTEPRSSEPDLIGGLLRVVAERGDPTGLWTRSESLVSHRWPGPEALALDRVADATAGLSYDDLRAGLLSEQISPAQADLAVRSLLDEGWLVERDGRITFEHPTLQEHWKAMRVVAPGTSDDDEDIPF
jgi:predicted HTH transcriptional regulator